MPESDTRCVALKQAILTIGFLANELFLVVTHVSLEAQGSASCRHHLHARVARLSARRCTFWGSTPSPQTPDPTLADYLLVVISKTEIHRRAEPVSLRSTGRSKFVSDLRERERGNEFQGEVSSWT